MAFPSEKEKEGSFEAREAGSLGQATVLPQALETWLIRLRRQWPQKPLQTLAPPHTPLGRWAKPCSHCLAIPPGTGSASSRGQGELIPSPPPWEPAAPRNRTGGGAGLPNLSSPPYSKKPFERFSWQSLKLQFIELPGVRPSLRGCREGPGPTPQPSP